LIPSLYLKDPATQKIHFIGIGGISMSGLAEILQKAGYEMTGSDMAHSKTTQKLSEMGIPIGVPHHAENIHAPDLVVHTAAVKEDNPELQRARALSIPVIDRATLLGEILSGYETSIACCGTHGKTTTTSMLSTMMLGLSKNPTIHIGGILPSIGQSTYVGSRSCFITEACEYMDSFLKLRPNMAILSNIELDHLDYFKDIDQLKASFVQFFNQMKTDGTVIANADDPNILSILDQIKCRVITYGIHHPDAHFKAINMQADAHGNQTFTVLENRKTPHTAKENASVKKNFQNASNTFSLSVPGLHNVSNALSAIVALKTLFPLEDLAPAKESLHNFRGALRRFEHKGVVHGIGIVDDYAHHPTEIKATLKAAKEGKAQKIFCIFQPHTYSRTKAFINEFAASFVDADEVILTDIYAAREKNTEEISIHDLYEKCIAQKIPCVYIPSFDEIATYILNHAKPGDLAITMGAGDVHTVADRLMCKACLV
jgi:UDP-N-acetylmuramate--alanine ligase